MKRTDATKQRRKVLGWVGKVNGLLDLEAMGGYGIVYQTRKQARDYYQHVVRVEVREVK